MNTTNYKILSQACFMAGNLSILGSVGLWTYGRLTDRQQAVQDALFVGLWVPSFYALADRLATAALDHQERRRFVGAGLEVHDPSETLPSRTSREQHEANEACGPVQSPRPLQHVAPR